MPIPAGDPPAEWTAQQQAQERAEALAWLSEHWKGDRICPICGVSDWGINNAIASVIQAAPSNAYAVFPVMCNNCKYTLHFNAVEISPSFSRQWGAVQDEDSRISGYQA